MNVNVGSCNNYKHNLTRAGATATHRRLARAAQAHGLVQRAHSRLGFHRHLAHHAQVLGAGQPRALRRCRRRRRLCEVLAMGAGRAERSGVDVGARERGATTRRKHRRTSAAPRRRKRYTANAESPAKAQNTLARAREEALMGAEEVCVHLLRDAFLSF